MVCGGDRGCESDCRRDPAACGLVLDKAPRVEPGRDNASDGWCGVADDALVQVLLTTCDAPSVYGNNCVCGLSVWDACWDVSEWNESSCLLMIRIENASIVYTPTFAWVCLVHSLEMGIASG